MQNILTRIFIIWTTSQVITAILFHIFLDSAITEQTTNFLVSGLQSTAAIVGIVFALSIIAIEHSASNYSPTMLEFFKKDHFVWFTAGYGLFTIGFIGSTIMHDWNFGLFGFIFFLWNLALLGIYLRYTLDLVNPIFIIKKIRLRISKEFKKSRKNLIRLEEITIKNTSEQMSDIYSNSKRANPSLLTQTIFNSNENLLNDVKKYEITLQNTILRSYEKKEYETTNAGIASYSEIVKQYLELKPDHYWPDDSFFELIRERIKNYASYCLQNNDLVFLKQIVDESVKIGNKLSVIQPLEPMGNNEPLVHLTYALSDIGKKCTHIKNWEGVLLILRALGSIGAESVVKTKKDSQSGNEILGIGKLALKEMDAFSCFICVNQAFKIFQKRALIPPDTMLESNLEELADFTALAYKLPMSQYFGNSFFVERSGINPLEYARNAIISCQENLVGETEITQRAWRIQNLKKHISLIIDFVGKINHWNANNILVKIVILYLQETQQMFHEPFTHEEEIESVIRGLSLNNGKGNAHLAELALICLENQYDDSAIKCIERIFLIAKNMMKSDEHGYDSNRAIRKLNLIGCYLQMKPNNTVLNKIIEKIIEFDVQFEERYNCSTSDELSIDNPSWASDPWDHKYRNRSHNFIKTIMQKNNRIQFEMSIVKAKIKCLKSRSSKNEK